MSEAKTEDERSPRPIACLNCRKRRSYCSKEKPRCLRCYQNGFICVYEENRKVTISESYLKDLVRKAEAYDQGQKGLNRSDDITSSDDEEYKDFGQERLLEPFTAVHIDKPSTGYKGPGSSDKFFESVKKLSGVGFHDSNPELVRDIFEPSALPCRRGTLPMTIRLPPPDVAKRLFRAQYSYIGSIFSLTESSEQLRYLQQMYRGPPSPADKRACTIYAKILVLLAFGQLYSVNQWTDSKGPPGFDYFAAALDYLPEAHEEGSIESVETLALVGYFMQNLNRRDAAFLYIGMALRIAISLGLHQELRVRGHAALSESQNSDFQEDIFAQERRRRVWWSIYSLDRILSVKSGNPISIADEDIGVSLPARLRDEPEGSPVLAFRHYTQLSRILSEIHTRIYSRSKTCSDSPTKTGRELMESVQRIILSLSTWNEELPEELRFDPAKLRVNRESVSIFAHYYQCINMTVRPLLFHVVKTRLQSMRSGEVASRDVDWRTSLSSSTVKMIDICIGGAQDVIHMMMTASKCDLVATYGYMDGEHISSATIVLVMACEALPFSAANTSAMYGGLELLRTMSERGNSQMGTRYELLTNIIANSSAYHGLPNFPSVAGSPQIEATTADTDPPTQAGLQSTEPLTSLDEAAGAPPSQDVSFTFPVIKNSYLGERFFDQYSGSTGMDFQLWEEGFANPTVDSDFDFSQWTPTVAEMLQAEDFPGML